MKQDEDPVVEEIQKVRKAIFKEYGYDTIKLGSYLQKLGKRRKAKHTDKRSLVVFSK